jgi:prepilin-type N-terminal cleavage/methylation domain-containing protein
MKKNRSKGFSLIELLTVVGIMALLMSISIPAIGTLARSSGVNQGASNLTALLEEARVSAMANSTYVYVGLDGSSNPDELHVSTMLSPTAEGNNTTNLVPLGKPVVLSKVNLTDSVQAPGAAVGSDVVNATESEISQLKRTVGGKTVNYAHVIKFAPDGTASAQANGISRWIQIGLAPASGKQSNPNAALIQISGLTGYVQIFRL